MASIKNQIKAYTATATKNDVTNYFVFLGGISGDTGNIVDETDISIVSRITKDEVATVVPRVNWSINTEYEPYTLTASGANSYILNENNGIVYLCVGKNQPTGLIGDQPYKSTISPTHVAGVSTSSDGYSWLALYKVDLNFSKFLNASVLPVNSLYDYRQDNIAGTYASKYDGLCTAKGATGSCYFYYNENSTDPITGITYEKGDRVLGFPESGWFCAICHETGEKLGYKSYHLDYTNKQTQILRNPLDEVSIDYANGFLDPNSKDYIQQTNFKYATDLNHTIISLQLDVSNLTVEERIVSTANPTVEILDPRGYGATARLTTYYDILRNAFVANGVELLSGGQDFVHPSFRVNGANSTKLSKAISAIVIDPPYVADPSTILPTPRVSIVKKFTNEQLSANLNTNQKTFTRVGVVDNVLLQDNTNAATGLIGGQKVDYRTTSVITLNVSGFAGPVVPNIGTGDVSVGQLNETVIEITTTDDAAVTSDYYTSKIVALTDNGDSTYDIELSAVDELTYDVITNASVVKIDNVNYTVVGKENPVVRVDFVDYVATKVLDTPINITASTSKQNSFTINFII